MTFEEATDFSLALILPGVVLVAVAWLVPTGLGRMLPQTMPGLGVNLIVSALVVWAGTALGFAASYAAQGVPLREISQGTLHFARLGALAAMMWGPVVLLALAMLPQHWRPEL